MLGGGGMGRLFSRPSQSGSNLCREPGGAPVPVYWSTRDGGAAERDSEPVQEIVELVHSSSTSSMSLVQGGRDLPTGKGGREEARGGSEGGEGAQGGAEGTVDGNIEGAGMGEERQMPYRVVKKDLSVLQSRCLSSL